MAFGQSIGTARRAVMKPPYDGNSHFSLNINDYLDTSAPAPLARHLLTARVTVLTEKY
jgi:hypothetical protein